MKIKGTIYTENFNIIKMEVQYLDFKYLNLDDLNLDDYPCNF